MARLNCVVRGVGESPFAAVRLRTAAAKRFKKKVENATAVEDAADRRENLPPARCARGARRPGERRGLHQRVRVVNRGDKKVAD